jgi:hypothetical protein
VWHKSSLEGIEKLSYKRKNLSDTAIKMVADAMLANITARGKRPGLSYEKTQVAIGNMFLHVFGQAIITTIFGRAAADLTGDIHERDQSALIFGGKLSAKDERFAIDNYCDLINNLHGQRWGEELSELLDVDDDTVWNPVSMALYANALQDRIAADMGWKMKSFTAADPVMIQFSHLLNEVAHGTLPPGAEEVIAARAREASAKAAAEAKKAAAKKAPAAQKP